MMMAQYGDALDPLNNASWWEAAVAELDGAEAAGMLGEGDEEGDEDADGVCGVGIRESSSHCMDPTFPPRRCILRSLSVTASRTGDHIMLTARVLMAVGLCRGGAPSAEEGRRPAHDGVRHSGRHPSPPPPGVGV